MIREMKNDNMTKADTSAQSTGYKWQNLDKCPRLTQAIEVFGVLVSLGLFFTLG